VEGSVIRVLVVDDFEPWLSFVRSTLEKRPQLQIVGEAVDGCSAIQKAQELQPDLILLDLSLPKVNGLEAARRIRECAPNSKILFTSEVQSWEIVREALRRGSGYVVKADAASELLTAVNAALQGEKFIGSRFAGYDFDEPSD
jgi:DNA-binding NarL/FixJ family response regulator